MPQTSTRFENLVVNNAPAIENTHNNLPELALIDLMRLPCAYLLRILAH